MTQSEQAVALQVAESGDNHAIKNTVQNGSGDAMVLHEVAQLVGCLRRKLVEDDDRTKAIRMRGHGQPLKQLFERVEIDPRQARMIQHGEMIHERN